MRVPVSVIIINNRADTRLHNCLDSVSWADQIVISDYQSSMDWSSFPSDQFTIISHSHNLSDFAQARNDALQAATHDWVLFIDSDEVLEENADAKIAHLITSTVHQAYTLKRVDIFYDQVLRWGEVRKVHLIRLAKKSAIHYERSVHEQAKVTGPIKSSGLLLFHHAHPMISHFLDSVNHYAQMEVALRKKINEPFSIWRLLTFPLGKFIYNFIIRGGFLDGWRGIMYATMMSMHSLLVSIYLYDHPTSSP